MILRREGRSNTGYVIGNQVKRKKGPFIVNYQYNFQFESLCNSLELGELITPPKAISGGLLHRMFALQTAKGKYAVKALNPHIMARPTALNNYITSERIVSTVSNYIPAQPAKIYNGRFLQKIDNQYYMIFDWIEGNCLKSHEITKANCKKIGSILADIHKIDFSQVGDSRFNELSKGIQQIDWNFYLNKGKEIQCDWVRLLSNNIEQLYLWNEKAMRSLEKLASESVFSHRDLEPKNVMWRHGSPILIDWESAGEISPKHDLIETAVYWSMNERSGIDKDKFHAFIRGYQECYGSVDADWRTVLELGYLSKLDWLEYSLKRSLQIDCTDETEQEMGTKHVTGTINALNEYEDMVSVLETWLHNLNET
ncbi:phosphotransferase [Paenibacillus sp. Marseille-P2973]|nr:phosphotransferase [Paenibacillus sp. Marseille-P2973]